MATQQEAIEAINKGVNTLVTGGPGVGKSFITRQIASPTSVMCAPTGIAALNVGGDTAHSLFGLPTSLVTEADKEKIPSKARDLFSKYSGVTSLRIDEIGMLRADYLDLIDYKLRKIRCDNDPFGGLQVVGIGDFFQLEPVVSRNEKKHFAYKSPFCFDAGVWNEAEFKVTELTKVYRQEDERHVRILNSIRKGDKHSKLAIQRINEIAKPYDSKVDQLFLCCYKKDAERRNSRNYRKIVGDELTYVAEISGKFFERPVEEVLKLRVGCKVIICMNDVENGTYKNGERGEVVYLDPDVVGVRKDNGFEVEIEKAKWDKWGYTTDNGFVEKEVKATFTQMPLRLGYASPIHKLQGATLEEYSLDLGNGTFSHGQLCVALSRITNLENLMLKRLVTMRDLIVDPRVQQFYNNI